MEQIIGLPRQAEVEPGNGRTVPEVWKTPWIHEITIYRRRRECGGIKIDQAKRLKDLKGENARLKRIAAIQALASAILKESADPNS